MVATRTRSGRATRTGRLRAPDLRSIYERIEPDALDLGRKGRIAHSRSDAGVENPKFGSGRLGYAALDLTFQQRINAAKRLPPSHDGERRADRQHRVDGRGHADVERGF